MGTNKDYVIKQIETYWSHDSLSLYKIWTCLVELFLSYSRNNPTSTNIWKVLSLTVKGLWKVVMTKRAQMKLDASFGSIVSFFILSCFAANDYISKLTFCLSAFPCFLTCCQLTKSQKKKSWKVQKPSTLEYNLVLNCSAFLAFFFLAFSSFSCFFWGPWRPAFSK